MLDGGSPAIIATLDGLGVDVIDATDGHLTYSLAMFNALGTVELAAGNVTTVYLTAAELDAPGTVDFAAFTAKGIDIVSLADSVAVLEALTPTQLAAYTAQGVDSFTVLDSGATLAALTPARIADLVSKGVTLLDSTDDVLSVDIAQLTAMGSSATFALNDRVTLADTAFNLEALSQAALTALAGQGIDEINATDNVLTISLGQLTALGAVRFAAEDLVTLSDNVTSMSTLAAIDVAAIRGLGVDVLTVSDTAANLSNLTEAQIATFATVGIDVLDASSGSGTVTLDVAKFSALGNLRLSLGSSVLLTDTGSALSGLTAAQIASLTAKGVDTMDATDNTLSLTAAKAAALGSVTIAAGDTVVIADTGSNIAALSAAQLGALGGKGIDIIDASNNALNLSVAQLNALGAVQLTAADAVTLADAGGAIGGLSASQIAALGGKGVDAIDASDNVLNLSLAQFNALGAVNLTAADTVTLTDAGGSISGLSAAQLAVLGGKGIDTIDASDNVLNLTLAQFNALGAVHLTAGDTVTLTDSGAGLSGMTPSQLAALAGQGVDALNATGPFTLTTAQYNALGIPLVGGGSLTVVGTAGVDSIFGTAGSDTLKGFNGNDILSGGLGDDKLFGGAGKDNLTGGGGRDAFVFDTALNKRTNVDKITDFNVSDDSVYLDNAVFKKIGKGTEAFPKKISKSFFTVGSEAKDKNDYVIYDKKKGILYYDQDGSGSKDQVEIATLKKNLKMTYNDFFVV